MNGTVWLGLILMATSQLSSQTTIIFDLGGVLFGQSRAGFIRSLGIGTLVTYSVFDRKAPWKFGTHLQDIIFAVCERMESPSGSYGKATYTTKGVELPTILCAYQAGIVTSKQVLDQLPGVLARCREEGFFSSYRQELLVKRAIEGIFDAQLIAKYIYPLKPNIELLKELSLIKNPDGSKKYRIMVLSNWDKESFEQVKKRFARQFAYFDQVIISGAIGIIKPNAAAFGYVLKTYGLHPQECIFIDDQPENIVAALSCGIEAAIQYKNINQLRYELTALSILPPSSFSFRRGAAFGLLGSMFSLASLLAVLG